MSNLSVANPPSIVNDFLAFMAELEAEETFEAAYAAAVSCYKAQVALTGLADWPFIWEAYQKAFGVQAGFYAPAPLAADETDIPNEDLTVWQMATRSGIPAF